MKRRKKKSKKKKPPRKVYHDTKARFDDPRSAITRLKTLYPDAPLWNKGFCPGCNLKKTDVKSINVWGDRHGKVKALYTLCPSCVEIAFEGTDLRVSLLDQTIKKNLRAWLAEA